LSECDARALNALEDDFELMSNVQNIERDQSMNESCDELYHSPLYLNIQRRIRIAK
jgi:hypothetical protein